MWRLDAHTDAPGWLGLPARVDDPEAWVRDRAEELRVAWAEHGNPEQSVVVEEILRAGLAARPADAALAFQLWPVPATLVAHVDAAFGAPPAGGGPREGILYEAEGLGVGVQTVQQVHDEPTGITLVGIQISFITPEAAVVVTFQPTIGELLTLLIAQFHAFVQTLTFTAPDGRPVVARAPAGFIEDASWADSLPAR